MPADASAWPERLEFDRGRRLLRVAWRGGGESALSFERLRVNSPSAEVHGHSAAGRKIVTGKSDVNVLRAEPVGRYAVRIVFDDGHDSGLFTWDWLRGLAADPQG